MPGGDGELLRRIARLADDNPWRNQLRDPLVTKDWEKLMRLAEEEKILEQPPANLLILSYLLYNVRSTSGLPGNLANRDPIADKLLEVRYRLLAAPGAGTLSRGFLD